MLKIANIVLQPLDHILMSKSFHCIHDGIMGEAGLHFAIRESIVEQDVPENTINCKANSGSDSRLLLEKWDFIAI